MCVLFQLKNSDGLRPATVFCIFTTIDMQDIDESPWDDSPSGGMTHAAEAEWTRLSSGFQNVSSPSLIPSHPPLSSPQNDEPPLRQVTGRIPRRDNRGEGRRAPRRVRYRFRTNGRTRRT